MEPEPTHPLHAPSPEEPAPVSTRFSARIRRLRSLGLGLGFFCVAAVLSERGAHPLAWLALVVNGFVWPQLAYALAARSRDPDRTELASLLADSALGGVWIAVMAFNIVPSALLVTMLAMDKIAVGGWRFLGKAAACQAASCLVAAALLGFDFAPYSSMPVVLACLPFMFGYPIAVSTATYALSRRVVEQNRQLAQLNRIDGLTGLLNRKHWQEAADDELRRLRRHAHHTSLMILDVDHFKDVNDRHGHTAGDEVMRRIAQTIRRCVREIDIAGRYGGDELCVILPDTPLAEAAVIAERIRAQVECLSFDCDSALRVTVSIGIAEATAPMRDSSDWVEQADVALYRAKTHGRNRVDHRQIAAA